MKSQASASSSPPPSAKPFTAAITGTGKRLEAREGVVAEAAEGLRLERGHALHLGDVGARRKGAARARDHHGAHAGVRRELADARAQRLEHAARQRVQLLGPIQGQQRHGLAALVKHELGQPSPPRNARMF